MAMNRGVRALLSWVKATVAAQGNDDTATNVEELQNGEILLKLVYILKKQPRSDAFLSNCTEDRFKVIADFIERDCRFSAVKGTPISWESIKEGTNLTTEISKVLLLLVYHDMMNDRCTLSTLDCDVESEIANLTATYVMESEESVHLEPGLDAYFTRRFLPVPLDIFEKSTTTSASSVSSVTEEDESPLFVRSKKVTFVDMQTVASSSVNNSPLQDIMNTPIFQMRKMQRQSIKDRDYRDALERELSCKLALLVQRESQINRLQYCLDKMKEEQGVREQVVREQIDELENKNDSLQSRFNDVLKQNKELTSNSVLIERKMDELADENGVLSSQIRTVCSQLAISEAEIGQLTKTQTSAEEEWRSNTSILQSELNQARAQMELLAEQNEILKGKISCLEDEICRSTKEEEGENMWPAIEKEMLESKISLLKSELESSEDSLQKMKVEVQAKTKQLNEYEQEISQQKELLIQQKTQADQLIQSKNEALENLQKEIREREALYHEICDLKVQLERVEQLKNEQIIRLQEHVASCEQEIEKLKESKKQKEDLLLQTEETVKDLTTKLSSANTLLADKDQEVSRLTEKVDFLVDMNKKDKDESQAKEEMFSKLLLEKSQEEEFLKTNICTLTDQIENLRSSLKQAEEQVQIKQDLLSKTQQEKSEQIEFLQEDIVISEETIQRLKGEIQVKDEQLVALKNDSSRQSERLQEEICALKSQIGGLCESLREAEEQIQTQQVALTKQAEESSQQKGLLQQQLSSSEEIVQSLKAEIAKKEEQVSLLQNQNLEHSELLKKEIKDLQKQVECLNSQLTNATENLHSKENDFTQKQQQSNQQVQELQAKLAELQDEVKKVNAEMLTKEEELLQLKKETSADTELLKTENSKQSELLQNEIKSLNDQVQSLNESLNRTTEQLQVKEEVLSQKEMEFSHEKDVFENLSTTFAAEIRDLKLKIQAKEDQIISLQREASSQSDLHQQEIHHLKNQLDSLVDTLSKAEDKVQTQLLMLTEQMQKSDQEQGLLKQKLSDSEAEIRKMEEEISAKEQQVTLLKTCSLEQSSVMHQEIESLQKQVESLVCSLKKAEDGMQSKECLLVQQQQENGYKQDALNSLQVKVEQVEKEISSFKQENELLKESLTEKEDHLVKAQEKYQVVHTELSAIKIMMVEKDQDLGKLREEAVAQANLIHKTKQEANNKDNMLNKLQDESSKQMDTLQHFIECLKGQVEEMSLKLEAKEEQLLKIQNESTEQLDVLRQELVSVNAELSQHKEIQAQFHRQNEEIQASTQREKDALVQEKDVLTAKILAVEKQLETTLFEKDRLIEGKQALGRQNLAAQKLETMLQQELEKLRLDKERLLKEKEKAEDVEMVKKDFLEQLSAKSLAAEHYKAQMEKAVSHYNSKKQLLQESEEERANLKHSLDVREREVKAATMENKLLQMELDKIQTNEKTLVNKVASLEAQLAFADKALRAQNKIHYNEQSGPEHIRSNLDVPFEHSGVNTRVKIRSMSSDSLDQSSLEDSLNNTRKLSAPGESSTPLVRSSERLAAKRRGLQAESLETLYFTPINTRHRTTTDHKQEVDSAMKNPASSVKRRRTTQVINITLTKKTPGCSEADETYYSLASARSQPNLSCTHTAQPVSTELFNTPARMTGSEADQLIGLPGYRRSTVHSQTTSTFCVGSENEPEGGPEDWMRIAEIQARNKACLPHLKSSYPLEFDTLRNSALIFTDEELRTGDPSETIRRASMMPNQLQDSLASHRHSLMLGQSGAATTARSRLSLMPGAVSSTHLRSPKATKRASSTLTIHHTSPEKKVKASCFPRPLTPKNKNVSSGPTVSKIHAALSPVDRRQSMMFTIDNTPKKDNYLKKGLNKLRSSTRKSPGKALRKSPAQAQSRRGQENIPAGNNRTATGASGRLRSQRSPLVTSKGQRKSPQVSTRAAKSPGLTASARKMMSRMKV